MNLQTSKSKQDPLHKTFIISNHKFIKESARNTKIVAKTDVLVIGAGPAGICAALAAAKQGAKVLIVERHQMLGGLWTAGLMNPLFDFRRKGFVVEELISKLKKAKTWRRWRFSYTFDTETMKYLLEQWCDKLKIEYWYETLFVEAIVEKKQGKGAIIESKSGREAILAKVCIDASGDGDLAARAGASYELGRTVDGLCQPMSLMFEIDGVPDSYLQKTSEKLYDSMQEAIKRFRLPYKLPIERADYVPWIINVPRKGAAVFQYVHIYRKNPLDKNDLTRAVVEARKLVHEGVEILKKIPKFRNIRLLQTAPSLGVRESRRIIGDYVLNLEDLEAGRRFEDAITFGEFHVDIHEPAPGAGVLTKHRAKIKPYEIPYRCLLPRDLENILTAGRCISGTHEAHASYRVTGTCAGTGQAAGVAAAMAVKQSKSPREIDVRALNQRLRKLGVGFLGKV